jgi:2-amino-4-hydroxy-6-hydroxymethyldihydropteridine diphosphokinase
LGALTWVTLILGLYYWVHKPLTPPLAAALGGALLDSAVAFALLSVGAGVGGYLLRRLGVAWPNTTQAAITSVALGLPLLSLILLGVGALALTRWSVGATLLILAALTWRDGLAWLRQVIAWLRTPLPCPPWERFLAVFVIGLAGLALTLAWLPPSEWDALTYHLAGPQQYVQEGRFYAAPHNHFLGFPQVVETLFAAQLALTGRLTGAAALHWGIGALLLLAVGERAARLGGSATGWLAAAILLSARTVWTEMGVPYVDLLPMLLAVVGLNVVERWDPSPLHPLSLVNGARGRSDAGHVRGRALRLVLPHPQLRFARFAPSPHAVHRRTGLEQALRLARLVYLTPSLASLGLPPLHAWRGGHEVRQRRVGGEVKRGAAVPVSLQALRLVALLGMLAGFGLGTKYSVLWLALAFGLVVLWRGQTSGGRAALIYGAVYGLAAFAVFLPWLVRNTLWYHNPLYPFVFDAAEMDSIRQDWYSQPGSGLIYGDNAWQLPLLPLAATVLGLEEAGTYGADIGPLFLALIPLLLLARRRLSEPERAWLRLAGLWAAVILAAWWLSAAFGSYINLQTRLVLYLFGPLAIAAALTLRALWTLPPRPIHLGFVVRVSPVYETEPWGITAQPRFLNQVVELQTDLLPHALLRRLKAIETAMGRTAAEPRYGPRLIDLDILFYDDLVLTSYALTVPHPRLYERAFVLVPLADLAADRIHPRLGITVRELLARVDCSGVRLYGTLER